MIMNRLTKTNGQAPGVELSPRIQLNSLLYILTQYSSWVTPHNQEQRVQDEGRKKEQRVQDEGRKKDWRIRKNIILKWIIGLKMSYKDAK